MLGTGLLGSMALLACPSERYTRPAGPAPRYESAPLAPWANETPPESGDGSLEGEIERALAADAGPVEEVPNRKETTQHGLGHGVPGAPTSAD
jgi:hypothetical protein